MNLTPAETEVLHLMQTETNKISHLAIMKKVSESRIRKIIKNLKSKGHLSENKLPLSDIPQNFNGIRLHGIELNINILFKDDRYKKKLQASNTITIDGNTIRLYADAIELYVTKSFYAEDEQKATARSILYIDKLLNVIENDLKILIVKSRSQNIKVVNAHYSEIHNELARELARHEKLKIYAREDGKLWFVIDNSFNLHEAECLKPETSKQDIAKVKAVFNDIRDNSPPLLSEFVIMLNQVTFHEKEIAAGLNHLIKIMQPPVSKESKESKEDAPAYAYFG